MELNEMEKKLLFQVEGDYQTKILNELYMTVRYSNNSEQREAAEGLMPSVWTSCGIFRRITVCPISPDDWRKDRRGQTTIRGRKIEGA